MTLNDIPTKMFQGLFYILIFLLDQTSFSLVGISQGMGVLASWPTLLLLLDKGKESILFLLNIEREKFRLVGYKRL